MIIEVVCLSKRSAAFGRSRRRINRRTRGGGGWPGARSLSLAPLVSFSIQRRDRPNKKLDFNCSRRAQRVGPRRWIYYASAISTSWQPPNRRQQSRVFMPLRRRARSSLKPLARLTPRCSRCDESQVLVPQPPRRVGGQEFYVLVAIWIPQIYFPPHAAVSPRSLRLTLAGPLKNALI